MCNPYRQYCDHRSRTKAKRIRHEDLTCATCHLEQFEPWLDTLPVECVRNFPSPSSIVGYKPDERMELDVHKKPQVLLDNPLAPSMIYSVDFQVVVVVDQLDCFLHCCWALAKMDVSHDQVHI